MQSDSSLRIGAKPASQSHKITYLAVVMTVLKTKRQPSASQSALHHSTTFPPQLLFHNIQLEI